MKTPDEIKKGLEVCAIERGPCGCCPYRRDNSSGCIPHKSSDALAYIEQLETKVAEYERPILPLTLDEVIEKSKNVSDNVVWLESPDKEYGYDDTECVPALLSNFSRVGASGIQYVRFLVWPKHEVIFPANDEINYGRTWRCWPRKPTDEERGAAEWRVT